MKRTPPGFCLNSTRSFYNRISFLYPVINYFLKGQKKSLIHEVNKEPPGTLLEIGIGNGSHLRLYAYHQVTGIEISEAMLKKAQRFKNDRYQLLLMNGENLEFTKASFDYVVMSHVLAVTKNPEQLLQEAYNVLKPGGKLFILNHFTPDNWLGHVDRAFQPLSFLLHFKSAFYLHKLGTLRRFTLLQQINLFVGSYFKLLIFCKP